MAQAVQCQGQKIGTDGAMSDKLAKMGRREGDTALSLAAQHRTVL